MWNEALFIQTLQKQVPQLEETTLQRMALFARLLLEQNETLNLTAITETADVAQKHFADSLALLPLLPSKTARVLDVGTGGGFPGVPLLIVCPALDVTLLDSTKKKLIFLERALAALELKATLVHARAEEAGQKSAMRGSFDACFSRAVAPLPLLCEYCLPFLRKGGKMLAMKGANAQEELAQSANALSVLGGECKKILRENLPWGERSIFLIEKTSQSPAKYPRPSAQIAKQPL